MEYEGANVLIIDDDESFARSITRSLQRRDAKFSLHSAHNEREAILATKRIDPEVIILDLTLDPTRGPDSGLSLIPKLLGFSDHVRIIVLTGQSSTEWGIRSINAGAASFVCKPPELDHLAALVEDGINVSRLMQANESQEQGTLHLLEDLGLSTKSERMKKTLEEVAFAAATPLPVLICGETGVGKGVVAQAIHNAGRRSNGPFTRLQPSFGSHDLIAAELFGHTRGAFTGARDARTGLVEAANSGTLFLDEIDTLPPQTQIALLHVLQEKEFQKIGSNKKIRSDFRLISATNCPFEHLIGKERLRSDFFHRIAHTVIHIPPLRERREDIPLLAEQFIKSLVSDSKAKAPSGISSDASIWLASQPWPGNVRELHAAVERGFAQAQIEGRRYIRMKDLQTPMPPKTRNLDGTLSEQLRAYELAIATSVFTRHGQNYSATARALGIDRKRLKRILSRLGVNA